MLLCFENLRAKLKDTTFESRMDSAFFSKNVMSVFDDNHVKFTASVPFERLSELKGKIEQRKRWRRIDNEWSYFETSWKPKSWDTNLQVVGDIRQFIRIDASSYGKTVRQDMMRAVVNHLLDLNYQ